jgi:ankyrin repeat protein
MKHLLLTTIAAVVLVGCGESQQSAPPTEVKPVEPIAEEAQPEPQTTKAPDISIHEAAMQRNLEAVKQHIAAGADVNAEDVNGYTPLDWAIFNKDTETADLISKHGGKTGAELKAEKKSGESFLPNQAKFKKIKFMRPTG